MSTRIDFSEHDESAMSSAAGWGFFIAIATMIGAAVTVLSTAVMAMNFGGFSLWTFAGPAFGVIVNVSLAFFLFNACSAFRKVAVTDEDDHGHLLKGFANLRAYFLVQAMLVILGVLGGGIALAVFGLEFGSRMSGF